VDLVLFVVEALRWTPEDALALEAVASRACPPSRSSTRWTRWRRRRPAALSAGPGRAPRLPGADPGLRGASGEGVEALERRCWPPFPRASPFPEDQITDRSERFFAAELLREQLTQRYGQELPYRTTVEIERFEDQGGRYLVHALIWVERPGQKAIVIGKGGEALKAAATQARLEMQKLFDCPVHLEVWVKVKKSWSSDEAALASLGYRDP
jgi:GTPase